MSVDEEGMTTEERRLFDDLVERITANKSEVLDVLAGESPVPDDPPTSEATSAADDPVRSREPDPSDPAPGPDDPAAAAEPADPEPLDPKPTDSKPGGADPRAADADDGSAASDALAGAMGGNESEPSADAPTGATEDDAATAPPEPSEGTESDGDDDPTPVPPEAAPPGAVGVDADDGASDERDGVAADRAASEPDEPSDSGATTDGGAIPETAASGEPDAGSDPEEGTERATVRITRDVGAIFGVDEREYELASEDVVSLPVENADPLVQRDAAERID